MALINGNAYMRGKTLSRVKINFIFMYDKCMQINIKIGQKGFHAVRVENFISLCNEKFCSEYHLDGYFTILRTYAV